MSISDYLRKNENKEIVDKEYTEEEWSKEVNELFNVGRRNVFKKQKLPKKVRKLENMSDNDFLNAYNRIRRSTIFSLLVCIIFVIVFLFILSVYWNRIFYT